MFLTSPLLTALGIPHAFTTRQGGVSSGIFSSLNFGNPSVAELPGGRDPAANIAANFARVMAALGCTHRGLVEVHQVHGSAVHAVRAGAPAHGGPHDTKADALVCDDPARIIAVRVADCCPILIASGDGRHVAAVHAGWRGAVAGIMEWAIAYLVERECAADLHFAIGPCIGFDAFEVGPEVLAAFRQRFGPNPPFVRDAETGKGFIDLQGAIAADIRRALGHDAKIDTLRHCTFSEAPLFFSHRRERGVTGRMAALIGVR